MQRRNIFITLFTACLLTVCASCTDKASSSTTDVSVVQDHPVTDASVATDAGICVQPADASADHLAVDSGETGC